MPVFPGSATGGYKKYRPSPSNPPYSDHNPQLMLTYLHALWKRKIDEIQKMYACGGHYPKLAGCIVT
jgi:hypothetical protein